MIPHFLACGWVLKILSPRPFAATKWPANRKKKTHRIAPPSQENGTMRRAMEADPLTGRVQTKKVWGVKYNGFLNQFLL